MVWNLVGFIAFKVPSTVFSAPIPNNALFTLCVTGLNGEGIPLRTLPPNIAILEGIKIAVLSPKTALAALVISSWYFNLSSSVGGRPLILLKFSKKFSSASFLKCKASTPASYPVDVTAKRKAFAPAPILPPKIPADLLTLFTL